MIKKIIHVADVHIPNSEERLPYGEMIKDFFRKLYVDEIKGLDASEIRLVVAGDIFHNKIRTTNEARALFGQFVRYCGAMCRTYLVSGNHDMLENNHDRMDSINPAFEIGEIGNVVYLDRELGFKSGCYVDDDVVFALYSIHDGYAAPSIMRASYEGKAVVGLFHGEVPGAVTDAGRVSDEGMPLSAFSDCDCVMAGHIHRYQELRSGGVPLVYSGSLFQQGMGENVTGHGYVVWDMPECAHRFVEVPSEHRTFKFVVNSYDAFENGDERLVNL